MVIADLRWLFYLIIPQCALALPNTHTHLPPFLAGPGGSGNPNQAPVAAALQGQPGPGSPPPNFPPQQQQGPPNPQNLLPQQQQVPPNIQSFPPLQQGGPNPQAPPPQQQGPPNPQTLPPQYKDQVPGGKPLVLSPQQGQGGPQILPAQQQGSSNQQRNQQIVEEQDREQQQRRHQQPQQPIAQVSGAQPLIYRPNPQSFPNAVPSIIISPSSPSSPLAGAVSLNVQRRVQDTDVQCLKTHMSVTFRFSAPFNGFIYPHNQFSKCLLYKGDNSLEAILQLRHGTCGDQENRITYRGKSFLDPVIEHRLMVQWEREIVSEDDSSVIVRCDRPDDYNKTVEWKLGTQEIAATLERAQHPGEKDSFIAVNNNGLGYDVSVNAKMHVSTPVHAYKMFTSLHGVSINSRNGSATARDIRPSSVSINGSRQLSTLVNSLDRIFLYINDTGNVHISYDGMKLLFPEVNDTLPLFLLVDGKGHVVPVNISGHVVIPANSSGHVISLNSTGHIVLPVNITGRMDLPATNSGLVLILVNDTEHVIPVNNARHDAISLNVSGDAPVLLDESGYTVIAINSTETKGLNLFVNVTWSVKYQ